MEKKRMTIKVFGVDGKMAKYGLNPTTKLGELMTDFLKRKKLQEITVKFMYGSKVVKSSDTPRSLEMDDEDEIDVITKLTGGGI